MKIKPMIENLHRRVAFVVLIVILVLTLLNVLGLIELIAAFMLNVISHQLILERWLSSQNLSYEEVIIKHTDGLWHVQIGNSVCRVPREAAKELHEYLSNTIYQRSDREDDHVF